MDEVPDSHIQLKREEPIIKIDWTKKKNIIILLVIIYIIIGIIAFITGFDSGWSQAEISCISYTHENACLFCFNNYTFDKNKFDVWVQKGAKDKIICKTNTD